MTERRDGGDFALMVALAVAHRGEKKNGRTKVTTDQKERKLCQYGHGKAHYYYHIIADNYYSR